MASLDDFFAKRDKKKGKGKKFTTTDEIAKKLEETGKKPDKVVNKKDRTKGGADDELNPEYGGSVSTSPNFLFFFLVRSFFPAILN